MTDAPASAAPLLEFKRVGKRYGGRVVLNDLSFEVARNEFVVLLGPSGAGKTTVLRLIAALEAPTQGEITVAGQPLSRIRRRGVPMMRRSIGLVLQDSMLLDDRNVLQNVALPLVVAGVGWRDSLQRAAAALQLVGLTEIDGHAFPSHLPRSARQRAALARAVVNKPALLLVDEPAAHLDHASTGNVIRLLEQFVTAGVTVVCTSEAAIARAPEGVRAIAIEPAEGQ